MQREIADLVQSFKKDKTFLIGVDGCGGSGKSSFARWLSQHVGGVVIHMDDFFLPSSIRTKKIGYEKPIAGDYDIQRVKTQILAPLREDKSTRYQRYDWVDDALAEWHDVPAGGFVLIEGVYALLPDLRDFYDFKVWVETPYDIRLKRGVERDGEGMRSRWTDDWMPSEQRYIDTLKPQNAANLVLDGSGHANPADSMMVIRDFQR